MVGHLNRVKGIKWWGHLNRVEVIKRWGHLNRVEGIKLVKKSTDWNPVGVRTKGRPKSRWRDEV